MTPLHHIRVNVFRVTQVEMAAIAGVRQSTVSRWDNGANEPTRRKLQRIRDEAIRRGLQWDDRWFFSTHSGGQAA
jgi:transcriptional regulator with XRE-family HTH domain